MHIAALERGTPGAEYIPGDAPGVTKEVEGAALSADQKKYMYAHCVAQFQFASVGTAAWEGTYGIPLPGIEPGPFWYLSICWVISP
mgnify:CR=1 FL=1